MITPTLKKVFVTGGGSRLPSAYQEVEYLGATNSQSINTKYIIQENDVIEAKFKYTDTTAGDKFIFRSNTIWIDANSTQCYVRFYSNDSQLAIIQPQLLSVSNIKLQKGALYVNDNFVVNPSPSAHYSVETQPLMIFKNAYADLYELKITGENGLIRHFIPCYNKYDDVAGLYDATKELPSQDFEGNCTQASTPTPESPVEVVGVTDTGITLYGIGNYKDSYDSETGKITRKIGVQVLNGTENWIDSQQVTAYIGGARNSWGVLRGTTTSGFLCSHAIASSTIASTTVRFDSDFNVDQYKQIAGVTDITSFKSWLAQQYSNGTPFTVYYPLATETYEYPNFYTNAGTGTFVVGPDVSSLVITPCYKTVYVYRGARLPSAYQEVEYLQSSGTQVINTGLSVNQSSKYVVVAKSNYLSQNNSNICGAALQYKVAMLPSENKISYCWNSVDWKSPTTVDFSQLNTFTEDGGKEYINDTLIRTRGADTFEFSGLTLFKVTGQIDNYQLKGAISSFKFWQDGTNLSLDLVPCYRKSDSVAGMYDLVNGVFYTNAGTGSFVVGPDANPLTTVTTRQTNFVN